MEVKVSHHSLVSMLKGLRGRVDFNFMENELYYQECVAKAEKLEDRLHELHDAVEETIERLHRVGDGEVEAEDGLQVAIAELNKVL